MYQYNQNKIDGLEIWPEFEKETHFHVPAGVVLIELEDCSDYATAIESRSLLRNEADFVPNDDIMTNKDYTFVPQHLCSVIATGDWR